MKNLYNVYLFDFDYTLADSSQGIVTCFRHVLNRYGYWNVDDFAIKRTIGKTLIESFSILSGITDAGISLPCDGPYQMVRAIFPTPDRRVTHDAVTQLRSQPRPRNTVPMETIAAIDEAQAFIGRFMKRAGNVIFAFVGRCGSRLCGRGQEGHAEACPEK